MKSLTATVQLAPPKLDQERAALRVELREKEGSLSKARQKRKFLEDRSAALAAQRQRVGRYTFLSGVLNRRSKMYPPAGTLATSKPRCRRWDEELTNSRETWIRARNATA